MYPDGNFICLGCDSKGTADDFLEKLYPGATTTERADLRQIAAEKLAIIIAIDQVFCDKYCD